MRTIPVYLMALIIAIANTPTDIYQICKWNVGTMKVEPWRGRIAAARPVQRAVALAGRVREWCTELASVPLLASERGEAAVDLLVPGATQLKALRQKAAEIHGRLKALNDKAVKAATEEGAPPLTDAERTEIPQLKAQFEQVDALRVEAERLNEAERKLTPLPKDPDAVAQRQSASGTSLEVGADEIDKKSKAPGFFGRQLQAVHRFAVGGGIAHLSTEDRQILKPMMGAATGMNTDIGSDGGFLVAQERSNTILQRSYSQGEILSRVGRLPIGPGSNGITIPAIDETSRADNSRFGGIVSGWLGQGNTLSSGKPKFRPMDFKLRKVGAFVYGTDELLADALALEGWINRYLPLELTFRTEDSVINGIGSNQPLGVLNSGAVITVTRGTASRVLSDDLRGMWNRMWAPARKNAVWLIDQSVEGEFDTLAVPIGTGGTLDPSYKPAGSVPGQMFATYKGRPIIPVEYCAALGTSGDIVLVALDEYTLIDKGAVEQAVSLHVAFLTDEQVFRFMYRVDGQLNWNAALTPKSGGSTLSCAVVLS